MWHQLSYTTKESGGMALDIYSVCLLEQPLHVMKPGFLGSEVNEIRMEEVTEKKVLGYVKQIQSTSGLFHSSSIRDKQEKNVEEFTLQVELTSRAQVMWWW